MTNNEHTAALLLKRFCNQIQCPNTAAVCNKDDCPFKKFALFLAVQDDFLIRQFSKNHCVKCLKETKDTEGPFKHEGKTVFVCKACANILRSQEAV